MGNFSRVSNSEFEEIKKKSNPFCTADGNYKLKVVKESPKPWKDGDIGVWTQVVEGPDKGGDKLIGTCRLAAKAESNEKVFKSIFSKTTNGVAMKDSIVIQLTVKDKRITDIGLALPSAK